MACYKYDFKFLESCTDGRLDELDNDLWETQKAIKAIKEYRKYKEAKE